MTTGACFLGSCAVQHAHMMLRAVLAAYLRKIHIMNAPIIYCTQLPGPKQHHSHWETSQKATIHRFVHSVAASRKLQHLQIIQNSAVAAVRRLGVLWQPKCPAKALQVACCILFGTCTFKNHTSPPPHICSQHIRHPEAPGTASSLPLQGITKERSARCAPLYDKESQGH